MARTPADPSARLAVLRAARAIVGEGDKLNQAELATAIGLTTRQLREHLAEHPEWPVEQRGSEGKDYIFDGGAILDAMIAHWEGKLREREERAERIAKLAGITVPAEAAGRLSLQDLREIEKLGREAQRRKIEQRDYVPKAEHEAVLTDVFTTVQTEILSAHAVLDPAGKWPPDVRADVIDFGRTLLVTIHDKIKDRLTDERSGRRARKRAGGARRR